MNANMAKVQSLIENAFTSAVEKLAKDESGNFISDLYVQADAESGELQIYDDEEHLIEKIVIDDDMLRLDDPLLKDLDADLDDFLANLLADVK